MKPDYHFKQSNRSFRGSFRGRGSNRISRSQRPVGPGRSVMAGQHINSRETVNKLPVNKTIDMKHKKMNTEIVENVPSAMRGKSKFHNRKLVGTPRSTIIVPKKFPLETMSSEQLNILENAILNAIDDMDDGPQARRPQFFSYAKVNGTLTIECRNYKSVLWLSNNLKNLKLWEDAQLKMIKPGEEFVTLVLPKAYPKQLFSSAELSALESEILKAIDQIPVGSFVPKFISCEQKSCSLKVNCFNLESVQWLKTTLEKLNWNGPEVGAFELDIVPIIFRVQLIIPGKSTDKDLVLQRLIRQNNEINISEWSFLSQEEKENNLLIHMLAKEEDIDSLKKLNFKLFYNFEQITIHHWKRFFPTQPLFTNNQEHSNPSTTEVVQHNSDEIPNKSTTDSPTDENDDQVMDIDDDEELTALLAEVDEIENAVEEQNIEQEK